VSDRAAIIETHSAVVVLLGDRAYKMKKPVDLGFLDFRDLCAREEACTRELALNRRLAADVYLGTARVVDDDDVTLEHLLVMRRLPAERRLDQLVASGADVDAALRSVVAVLVALHERSPVPAATAERVSGPEAVTALWASCTEGIRRCGNEEVPTATVDAVERLATRFLAGRAPLLLDRVEAGSSATATAISSAPTSSASTTDPA
jgi:aminoglycoside phosphotransferase family enzyme